MAGKAGPNNMAVGVASHGGSRPGQPNGTEGRLERGTRAWLLWRLPRRGGSAHMWPGLGCPALNPGAASFFGRCSLSEPPACQAPPREEGCE